MSQIIGIGNADNDIIFFKNCWLPIVMGNANDNVKELCKIIIDDNDHDGISKSIYKYFIEN